MSKPATWSLKGFLRHFRFVHEKRHDQSFAWFIGAGASRSSGIPTGAELVDRWLRELHERLAPEGLSLRDWATADILAIKGFQYDAAASFYPDIYEVRFRDEPDEGYAYLEDVMSGKEPGPGYSILAKTLETQRHRVVVTTNFDNLVADALSIYSGTFPLICGHESLAAFVRVSMRRPLVCKIHRDLLLAPKNDRRSLKRLHDEWGNALRRLLEHYTPLFIGYGGNDDTLMDLLESLTHDEIKGRMIWCYYEKSDPSERIRELVAQQNGVLVPVPDFDLLMVLLGAEMQIEPLDYVLEERAKRRTEEYKRRILSLDTEAHPEVAAALASTFRRVGGWWAWELKARAATDLQKVQNIYRQGIEQFPNSAELHANLANMLTDQLRAFDEAERLYKKAIELDPQNALIFCNYAHFLAYDLHQLDRAELFYRNAFSLDPSSAVIAIKFACFLGYMLKKHQDAEEVFRKAVELAPDAPAVVSQFACFAAFRLQAYDEAEGLFRRAIELAPYDWTILWNYATFLERARNNLDEAEHLYRKALSLDPTDEVKTGNFGKWLAEKRGKDVEAEQFLIRASDLDPSNALAATNVVGFLIPRGRLADARRFLERAEELTPKKATQLNAVVALYRSLIEHCCNHDDSAAFCHARQLAIEKFERDRWTFDALVDFVEREFESEDCKRYLDLVHAILDSEFADEFGATSNVPSKRTRPTRRRKGAKSGDLPPAMHLHG